MKKLFILILCLLLAVPAYADVAYEPPSNSFYEKHRAECRSVERNFYSNGQAGYITLYKSPDGLKSSYLTNGVKLRVHCTYGEWAMITHQNGNELSTPVWTEQSEVYLIYDCQSFLEEYSREISTVGGKMLLPEGAEEVYVYEYPGAADPIAYDFYDDDFADASSRTYTDTEGRKWGYITYYRGVRDKWVCLSDPFHVIPPFGGDPNLALIEGTPTPDTESPDPDTEIMEAETPIIPAETPPKVVWNSLPVLAAVLVAAAVVLAIILILVCFRKKKED